MAGYEAIAALGETVVRLLNDARTSSTDAFIRSVTCDFFRKPIPGSRPLLTLHLYRVALAEANQAKIIFDRRGKQGILWC